MRLISLPLAALLLAIAYGAAADGVDPAKEARAFRDFFVQKFPNVKLDDFVNGPYALNEDMRRQWEEKEQFPPYEFSLETGKELFAKPFANGKHYADCADETAAAFTLAALNAHAKQQPFARREVVA